MKASLILEKGKGMKSVFMEKQLLFLILAGQERGSLEALAPKPSSHEGSDGLPGRLMDDLALNGPIMRLQMSTSLQP